MSGISVRLIPAGEAKLGTFTVYCPHHKTPWTVEQFSYIEEKGKPRSWATVLAEPAAAKRAAHHIKAQPYSERPPHLRSRPVGGVTVVNGKPVPLEQAAQHPDKHTTFEFVCTRCGPKKGGKAQRREEKLWPLLDLLIDGGLDRISIKGLSAAINDWEARARRVD